MISASLLSRTKLKELTHDAALREQRPQLLINLGDCYEGVLDYEQADQAWYDAVAYDPYRKPEIDQRHQRRPDTGTAGARPWTPDD